MRTMLFLSMKSRAENFFTRSNFLLLGLSLLPHRKEKSLNFTTCLLLFCNLPLSIDFHSKINKLNFLKNLPLKDGTLTSTKPNKSFIKIKKMEPKYLWLYYTIKKDFLKDLNLYCFTDMEDLISLYLLGSHLIDLLWWITLELILLLLILEVEENMERIGINKALKKESKMFSMTLSMQVNI